MLKCVRIEHIPNRTIKQYWKGLDVVIGMNVGWTEWGGIGIK